MVAPLLAALAPAAMSAIERLLDRVIPDPEQKAKAMLELRSQENAQILQEMQIALQADQGQMEINKIEAASTSLFVSGARPFIMWTCGVAFAYHFVIMPFAAFVLSNYMGKQALLPAIDMEVIGFTLTGMLGIGGTFRTIEKIKLR